MYVHQAALLEVHLLSVIECIQSAFMKVSILPQCCDLVSHNVGPVKSLAAILQAEAPVVVLQMVVV